MQLPTESNMMDKQGIGRVDCLGVCRGNGSCYAKLKIAGVQDGDVLVALAGSCGISVPVSLFATDNPIVWIIQMPVLETKNISIEIVKTQSNANHVFERQAGFFNRCDSQACKQDAISKSDSNNVYVSLGSIDFNFERIKWESRFNYRFRQSLCAEIRDYEQSHIGRRFQPEILGYFEGDNEDIWRVGIHWRGDSECIPWVSILDGMGKPLAFEKSFFELQTGTDQSNTLIYSFKLPKGQQYFSIVALPERSMGPVSDALDSEDVLPIADDVVFAFSLQEGFAAMNAEAYRAHKNGMQQCMADAASDVRAYQKWFAKHVVRKADLRIQRSQHFEYEPLISLIVPCFNSQKTFLHELCESIMNQSYSNWELILVDATCQTNSTVKHMAETSLQKCADQVRYLPIGGEGSIVANTNYGIQHARGQYVVFIDHDDLLEPDALYVYVEALNEHPDALLLYCDEDAFEKKGHYKWPSFKSKMNLDLLYSHNYVTHMLMVQKEALLENGLSDEAVSGAQDYDVTLKMVKRVFDQMTQNQDHVFSDKEASNQNPELKPYVQTFDDTIIHIPRVLYHWRIHPESTNSGNSDAKPYADKAGQIALQRHFDARGIPARIESTQESFVYKANYLLDDPHPKVSIIIPSKDHSDVLDTCLRSILEKTTYDNYEIIVVENNSTEPETFKYYESLEKKGAYWPIHAVERKFSNESRLQAPISILVWPHEFNYSKIVNFGAQHATGDYLLFLNNDTEVIASSWLEEMVGYFTRPEVGVVGVKLYFRDGLVQHAGVQAGPYDEAVHVNQNFSSTKPGYLSKAVRPGNFSAVTGACQMVRASLFYSLGGYDERFVVGFNDVDFCMRVQQAGYFVVYSPYVELYHFEFVSRGRESVNDQKKKRWESERDLFMKLWPDPFETRDPYSNPNLKRNSAYFALGD